MMMRVVCNEKGLFEVIDEAGDVLAGGFETEELAWHWMDQQI